VFNLGARGEGAHASLRVLGWRPDRTSASAIRCASAFRQEPDTRTGVSTLDTPAMTEF
jgi:hypothetical protein